MISSLADADVRGHTPALRKKKGGLPSSNKIKEIKTQKKMGQGIREVVRRRSCAGGEGRWRAWGSNGERSAARGVGSKSSATDSVVVVLRS